MNGGTELPRNLVRAVEEAKNQLENRAKDVVFNYSFRATPVGRFKKLHSSVPRFAAAANPGILAKIRRHNNPNVQPFRKRVPLQRHAFDVSPNANVGERETLEHVYKQPRPRGVFPNLKKEGMYQRSILGHIAKSIMEPQAFMKRIGFPTVAYKDVKRLTLIDNLNARAGK